MHPKGKTTIKYNLLLNFPDFTPINVNKFKKINIINAIVAIFFVELLFLRIDNTRLTIIKKRIAINK